MPLSLYLGGAVLKVARSSAMFAVLPRITEMGHNHHKANVVPAQAGT